jgi:hypothetical protein
MHCLRKSYDTPGSAWRFTRKLLRQGHPADPAGWNSSEPMMNSVFH